MSGIAIHALQDEQALFGQIAGGDEQAFKLIFHAYNAKLYPFVLKVVRSPLAAEEIIQELFLRLWIHREKLAEMEQPASWLYKVAANLALSYLRKQAAEVRRVQHLLKASPGPENNVDENISVREIQALFNKAVEQLPSRRRLIYVLSREEGLNHREIAEKLNISKNTVKNQLVSAMKSIQDYIQKETALPAFLVILLFVR